MMNKYMKFMTVHKSKGLEAENVVILNLENSITSFPCKIEDSEYLKYVIPKEDDYAYAEERRLFYVALTRAKSTVTLLVNKNNPSIFVTETVLPTFASLRFIFNLSFQSHHNMTCHFFINRNT